MSTTHSEELSDQQVYDLLHFDPLAFAEQVTGHSYKEENDDGKATTGLGMLLHMDHAQRKDEILAARGDTTFRNDLVRYTEIITAYGFRKVVEIPFQDRGLDFHFFVYWHDELGLLLEFDTYRWNNDEPETVNGGNVHYQWEFDQEDGDRWRYTSTGGARSRNWDDPGEPRWWEGSHDCREGLIFNLEQLRTHGTLKPKWTQIDEKRWPGVYLTHHGDNERLARSDDLAGWDHDKLDALLAERYAMLPDDVREATGL